VSACVHWYHLGSFRYCVTSVISFPRYCVFVSLAMASITAQGQTVVSDTAAPDACGDISIATMNWTSAEVLAQIDGIVLTAGFGCNVTQTRGDIAATLESLAATGKPDIIPEVWVTTAQPLMDSLENAGDIVIAGEVLEGGGQEGFWIREYIAHQHPEIQTIEQALKRPDVFVFDEDEERGALHNCAADWQCHIATTNIFDALDAAEKGFALVDAGSAAGLDASIISAHANRAGWLGYYWEPSALLGQFDMVKLEVGEHDAKHWSICTTVPNCQFARKNDWPMHPVVSVVSDEFAAHSGPLMQYIQTRRWDAPIVNKLLAWINNNQATAEEAARHFLENHRDLWADWVTPDVRAKVDAAL